MPLLEDLRAQNPRLKSVADDQLIGALAQQPEYQGLSDSEMQALAYGSAGKPEKADPGFTAGFSAGVDQLQAMGGGLLMAAGEKLGSEDTYKAGKGVYDRNMAEAGENDLGYGFTDLFTDPETSALQWASYTAGNLVPTMATAVAGGGAGGVAARMLAGAAAKRAATQAGQAISAYAASAGMETGSIMGEVENADVALAHGSIAGALDALPVMRALRKFGGKEIADRAAGEIADNTLSSLKRTAGQSLKGATGKGMLTQAMAESSTEALQTLIEQNASYWVENNGQTLLSDLGEANWKQVIDAAAAGGLGGAMMGAPAGIAERGQARRAVNKLPADRQAEGSRQAEPQAEPEPDWSAYDTPPALRAQRRKEQAIAEARQQTAAAGGDALQQAQAAQQAEQMAEGASQDEQAAEGPRQGAEVGNRIQLAMNAAEDMEALANGTEQGKTRLRNMNAVLQRAETAYADGNIALANRLTGRAEMIGRNLTQSLNRQGSRERPATGTWERAAPFGGYLGQDSAARLNAPDPSVINMGGPTADTTQYDPQARTVRRDERMQAQQQGEARLREQMTQQRPQLADQGIVYGDGPVARRGNANTGLDQPFERAQFSDTRSGRNPEAERAQQQGSNQRVAELARTRGPTETTYLPDNTPVKTRYRVMDLAELTPSNTDDGRVNQAFPAELQPRDRTNANSQVQVRNIAANLNPERLGPSADAATGAPIVGPDGVVESGNGRTMAISQAYRQGRGSAYRQYVGQQAEAMGMDPAAVGEMQQPVLVRERITSMDRADFARRANESTVAGMTAYEQARADADALTAGDIQQWNPDQSGDPLAASNRAFQRTFVSRLGNNEAARYTTRDGQASPELGQRMQRTVFAKAYADSDMVEMATEQGEAMRNLTAALQGAAADLAAARETGSQDAMDAIGTINDAVRLVRRSRQDGTPVRELVSQQDVFSEAVPALTADLAVTLNNNMRSRRALGEAMRYIGQAIRQRAESERNGSLFEDTTTNQDVIDEGFRQADTQQRAAARDVSGRARQGAPRTTEGRQVDATQGNATEDSVAEPLLSTYTEQDIAEREQAARQEQQAELTESQGEATLQQSAPEGFEPYRTHVRAMGEMWAVPERAGQQQSGDSLFETREEALEEAGRNARRADQRSQIQEEAAINQQREEQQQAREKADLDELAAILGVTRPGAGKARDALNRRMRFDGRVMTRKERIERAVEDGAIMQGEGSNRRLVDEDGAFYQQSTLTKTGMDYAEALIRRREDGKQAAAQAARDPVAPEHLQATDSPADRDTSETSPDGSDRAADVATARGQGDMRFSLAPPTESQAFKRWFDDSKAVDENGNPRVVYHGTISDIKEFSDSWLGTNTQANSASLGFFFTSDPETAEAYADMASGMETRRIMEEADKAEARGDWDAYDRLTLEAERAESDPARGQSLMPVYLSLQNPLEIDAEGQAYENVEYSITERIKQARESGRDGVIIRNLIDDPRGNSVARPSDHYVAFNSTQIKSVNNRGTYDPNNPDIRYSLDDSPADQPPTAEAVRNAMAGMEDQLGDVTVIDSARDLPERALFGMALNSVNPRDVRGLYLGDKLYVIAGNNDSIEEAVRTAVHEAVGHKGMRGVLGEELTPVMRQLYKTLPLSKQGKAALDEVLATYTHLDRNNPDDQITIAEEMIAHLLEKGYRPKVWQRAVAKIRELLRTMFPGIGWSYTDVLLLGEKSRDYLRRKQAEASGEIVQRYSLRAQPRTTSEAFDDLTDAQTSALNKIAPRTPKESALAWFKEHTDRLGTKIRQGLVDRYAALKELDEKLLGKDSVDGSTASSSWVLARMSSAASGALTAMLNYGRIYLDPDQKVIDVRDDDSLGLGSVLGRLGDAAEIERFMGWIAGNRSARLAAEGRENLFEAGEIEGLRTLNQGTTKDGRDRGALYDEVFAEFQQYRDDVLAIAEQSGIISAENRAMWRDEFYVPFYRISEEAKGPDAPRATSGLTRAEAYKKLRGGSGNLNDLLSNTMMNFHHLLQTSLNNQAAVQAMDNAEAMGIASQAPESQVRGNPDATFVLRDGQKVWYEVSDPLVYKAISSLADPGMNTTAMKVMRSFKRVFTNMTTTTPQFVVANMLRDSMQAAATSPLSKNIPANMFRGARTYADKRTRARMMASGGSFSFGYLYGENADELKVQLTSQMRKAHLVRDPSQVPAAAKLLWSKWNDVTDFTENISRAEIYRQNEARGKLFAAFQARDLMDFSSKGAWPAVRFLIDVVPFMNARLQGLDKIGRSGVAPTLRVAMGRGSASDKEAAARFWTVTGSIAMASIALYLNNYDDEEYRKLEDWQKDTYWFFRIGDQGIFIPKPFEVGAIATLAERMTEQMVDDKATGELFRERLWRMFSGTFSFSMVPQIAQPMLDVYSNYDAFTGRPIESMGMDRLSPSLRSRSSTTAPAQWISDASEALFGPEGKLTVSPVQVDHLIQGYLGQVGAWGAGITDTIARTMQGETKPASYWYEYQPIRRFYQNLGDEDRYNRYGTLFYEGLNEVGRVYADIKEYRELGEQQQAMQLLNDNREMLRMRKWLNRVQSKLSTVNKRMQMVQRSDNSAEFKRREMDRLRAMKNRLTEMAGRRIERVKAEG